MANLYLLMHLIGVLVWRESNVSHGHAQLVQSDFLFCVCEETFKEELTDCLCPSVLYWGKYWS